MMDGSYYFRDFNEMLTEFRRHSFNMPGYEWQLEQSEITGEIVIQFTVMTKDTYDKQNGFIRVVFRMPIRRDLPKHMLTETLHQAVRKVVMHETDEWFKYDNEIVFNPHKGSSDAASA